MVLLNNDWDELLSEEFKKEYYLNLRHFLKTEYFSKRIYPPMNDIYNALRYTSYKDTRVVILGQDPYHGPGQAHGLCFSVKRGIAPPPSLKNIFKELNSEHGIP
jgi:uracil-DNA glycosylase